MRAIWSGALSFGLIYIPIKLYDATSSHKINFELIRRKDHCRIHYAKVCRETGEEVPTHEVVRGYQYQKGSYVEIEDEDIRMVNVKKTQTIEIASFINADEVDHKCLEKPYYLEPVLGAQKAYTLLREALRQSNKTAIGKFVMRMREHPALITPEENVLVLNRMRFPDEIRSASELNLPDRGTHSVHPHELDMAISLIEQLTVPWDPIQLYDTYYADLKQMIKNKVEGKKQEPVPPPPKPEFTEDLFERLSKSLEQARLKRSGV